MASRQPKSPPPARPPSARNPRNPAKPLIDAGTESLRQEAERDWAKSDQADARKKRRPPKPTTKPKAK